MKAHRFRVIMAMAISFLLLAALPAYAATLSLQATSDGSTTKTQYQQGDTLLLNILVDDPTGIAGVAFTLTYNAAVVTPPAIGTDGLPTTTGDISSIFPFTYQGTDPDTDTFRANDSSSKIYLSGAAINESNGGPLYTAGSSTVLFTIKFIVKADAVVSTDFTFGLEQTQLFNPAAGYGTDANGDGIYDAGTDTMDPVPVLVGALSNADTNFGGDLSDDFPVLLGDASNVFSTVTSATLSVVDTPKYDITGTVTYSGSQTGTLTVGAFASDDTNFTTIKGVYTAAWSSGDTSKTFTVSVPDGGYKLGAYIETGNNTDRDAFEAQGEYTSPTITIAGGPDGTSREFALSDPVDQTTGDPLYYENWKTTNGYGAIGLASADYDKDGYSNLQELLNGTNPTTQDAAGGTGYNQLTDNRVGPCTPITGNEYNMIAYGTATDDGNPVAIGDWIYAYGPAGPETDCRAVAQVTTAGQYYLTVRGNTNNQTINFKMRRDADLKVLSSTDTITFVDGSTAADKALAFTTARTQTFVLGEGWNWISFNVQPADTSSLEAVFGADLDKFEQIKTQTLSTLNTGTMWLGDKTTIMGSIAQFQAFKVKVKAGQAFTLSVSGQPLDPQAAIALQSGWSWVAYLPNYNLETKTAIDSVWDKIDQFKSQTQSKLKINDTTFLGDLTTVVPSYGYKIKLTDSGTLTYPVAP